MPIDKPQGPLRQYLIVPPKGQSLGRNDAAQLLLGRGAVKDEVAIVNGVTASIDDATRDDLSRQGYTVVNDDMAGFLLPTPTYTVQADDPLQDMPADPQAGPRMPLMKPRYDSDIMRTWTGRGVGIAYVDTGLYPHRDTPYSRIPAGDDEVGHEALVYDDNGHGSGTVGMGSGDGSASNGLYRGTAPNSSILPVKVLNRYGQGRMSDILKGIEWCIDNRTRYNIRVMNLSLGGHVRADMENDPLQQAVMRAWDAGIVVCVAAGNEGPNPGTISSPGDNPKVITVGAYDDYNDPDDLSKARVCRFTSVGPTPAGVHKPDLVAPGEAIFGPNVPGSPSEDQAQKYTDLHHALTFLADLSDDQLLASPSSLFGSLGLAPDTVAFMADAQHRSDVDTLRRECQRIEQATARLELIDGLYLGIPGSSRATPFVSGVVADMLEANPYLLPDEVKDILMSTARPLPGVSADVQGAGALTPQAAIAKALSLRAEMEQDPQRRAMVEAFNTAPPLDPYGRIMARPPISNPEEPAYHTKG